MEVFMLQKFELGKEAIRYIYSCLCEGKTLSNYLLQLPLDKGRVISFLPNNVDSQSINNFQVGGIVSVSQTESKISSFIEENLQIAKNRIVIFEDAVAEPHYSYLYHGDKQFFLCKNEVYHYVCSKDIAMKEKTIKMLRTASSYLSIGALSEKPNQVNIPIRNQNKLSQEELQVIALNSKYILVGAYDEEGILIWIHPNAELQKYL